MDTSPKSDVDEERSSERGLRRMRTLEEKLAILEEADQPGASVAAVARKHGLNANLLFGWRRQHRRGLLEGQRHTKAVPLLPVKVTTPTLTPTEPSSDRAVSGRPRRARAGSPSTETMLEIVLPDGARVRMYGEAQRTVMDHILQRLVRR